MNTTKFLKLAILILFCINMITLVFFITKGPKDRMNNRKRPSEIIIEKLHFDANQIKQYEELINNHQKEIIRIDDEIKNNKTNLYRQLSNPESKIIDSLFQEIANKQNQIEKTHFDHFLAIKKLCKEEQLKDFDDLTNELSRIFSKPKPRDEKR